MKSLADVVGASGLSGYAIVALVLFVFAFLLTGIIYALIMCAAMTALYFSSWERPAHEVVQERAGSLWQALKKLAKDMISTFHLKIFPISLIAFFRGRRFRRE